MIEFFIYQHGTGILITVAVAVGVAIWFKNTSDHLGRNGD